MLAEDIAADAEALLNARRTGEQLDALPFEPASFVEAYAIQDAVAVRFAPAAGWKLAPHGEEGIWCAPLYRPTIHHRPILSVADLRAHIVEVEIAFRMTQDIARGTSAEALRRQMVMVPLFEVLAPRLADFLDKPFLSNLADCYGSAAIGLGDEVAGWANADRDRLHLTITADGVELHSLELAEKLDFAVDLVAKFAERFVGRFEVLPAGSVVTTGAIRVFPPARHIVADYGALGVNELTFSDL